MSLRLRLFVGLTTLAALAVLGTNVPPMLRVDWGHFVAWTVICLVSETMWTQNLSGAGTWSLAAAACLSTIVLWGTEAGIWIGALSTLVADLFVARKPWVKAAFNAGQITLTSWCAGLLFEVLGGRAALPVAEGGAQLVRGSAPALAFSFVALAVAFFAVNRAMVALAVAWSGDRTWWRVLREDWLFVARLELDASSFMLVPLMVISYIAIGYPGVLLFFAPLFMLLQSDRRYHDLRKAEEHNLRNARFAAKGELAAGIGHELNNQLVAITARAQMLLKDAERQRFESAPRHAQIILDQSRRMGVLAKGLMDYTRNQVNAEPLDLNSLLLSTIEFVKGDKRFRAIEWEVELDSALPQLRGDIGQIQGVFINLFVNAADAMAEQESRRAISVRTALDDRAHAASVVVADTGPGIRAEHLPHMFEFMFTTKPEGHGFGLSTSHRAIENHGGRITVESPSGSGARFAITLPLRGPWGSN